MYKWNPPGPTGELTAHPRPIGGLRGKGWRVRKGMGKGREVEEKGGEQDAIPILSDFLATPVRSAYSRRQQQPHPITQRVFVVLVFVLRSRTFTAGPS